MGHMISSGTSLDVVVQLSKRLASISGQASINSQQDLMLVFYKMGDPGREDSVVCIFPTCPPIPSSLPSL